ncbi:uncharacterized protein LOC114867282 [Betta splendens]|uniref:Uncharacterized protein LOC114867282 n=1 Tax=Betta splendens TaxID=158456 RepID=A0A6P7P635_BETSP|nr:uncharacterized protein LOC114867282 [Betta splendens]
MLDWANKQANNDIDLIVLLTFKELNSIRDSQSMDDFLNHCLSYNKKTGVSFYNKCKLAFILYGLEQCELHLDFDEELTDLNESTSMDVLLTNLIKGTLLPSAQLWIISSPSGVGKIPPEYIHRVTECREKDDIRKLKEHMKNKLLDKYKDLSKETDTELYEIKIDKKDEVVKYNDIFTHSKQTVRTVLTKGVAGIGKTFQVKKFMVDWANERSNRNIDLIISLMFSELDPEKVHSMEELLNSYFSSFQQGVWNSSKCKLAFILDGLEQWKLPLDFENNKELTDLNEAASMDVLLTNLIKGTLLPSDHIWIISQPSGVDRIPSEFIQKTTECRETLKRRQKLVSDLRTRFQREYTQVEDLDHPNQKNTEHIMREDRTDGVNDQDNAGQTEKKTVNSVSDIFKDADGKNIRTVLTTGEADIGKTFLMNKLTKQWAENKSSVFDLLKTISSYLPFAQKKDEELTCIFPLNFSKLSLMKGNTSLVGLLNDCFEETKKSVISDFAQFKLLFLLDGLDEYKSPLDFNHGKTITDVRETASVSVLLMELIKGSLLPPAKIWITSRPSDAERLPIDVVQRSTEIREKPDIASQRKLKSDLRDQFTRVSEGIDKQKTSALLNDIFTDLYIIEGERGEVNSQSETRQVQDAKFKGGEETLIKYHDIFKTTPGETEPIRTVLTIGMAGIGKTFASMKYMLDWAEGKANESIYYTFPLPLRELNLRKDTEHSFEEVIHQFFPAMERSEIKDYKKYKILIVLDGFDESRLDIDFGDCTKVTDMRAKASVKVLLTNLIQGHLLPEAQIWITSRPAASNNIPAKRIDRVTEVRGFNDEQKEEYFRKRFIDKDLAEKILAHVKKSRSLYIMCHIPVFCWITSEVLEDLISRNQDEGMPKSLTDMYISLLLLQCRQANVKYGGGEQDEGSKKDSCWNTRNKETVLSLAKLAFDELQKGNLLFTEENLTDCGINIENAAVFSGLFTQIKREGRGLYQQKLFCFAHLSIQEFLAAFHASYTFCSKGENLLTTPASTNADLPASDFYKTAVEKALSCETGDWDLFLRFLLGLSLETNQNLLQDIQKKTQNTEKNIKKTIEFIKEKLTEENSNADKNLNLLYCLNELNDHSLVKEVKTYLQSETKEFETFSVAQWSALTFVLLTSDEKLDVFDLKKYLKSEKVLLGMLPVVKVSKTTLLSWCELSEESCRGLNTSVLTSASSNLTKLDMSHNDLCDSGVKFLADGLKSVHCKLEILKLAGCQVTEKGCLSLADALKTNRSSHLKELDLRYNHPGDIGINELCDIPNLKLRFERGGEHRLKSGLKKYAPKLVFDENTAGKRLVLCEGNRKVKTVKKVDEKVSRPENDSRFKRSQVLCECEEGLDGICYWEVEWAGTVGIAVTYEDVGRRWDRSGGLGCNENSWSLLCSKEGYKAIHGTTSKPLQKPCSQKLGVFLDWECGILRYLEISSERPTLIHEFKVKFTKPLFPGFWFKRGSVTLCEMD